MKIILGIAAMVASAMLCIALDHNPQGAFYGAEIGTQWRAIMLIWLGWFIAGCALLGVNWALWRLTGWVLRRLGEEPRVRRAGTRRA